MGEITKENLRKLIEADTYEEAALDGMNNQAFAIALNKLMEDKGATTQFLVGEASISKSYVNKLRNPSEKVQPTRNMIIDIALALNATYDETNHLLKLAHYQGLYTRDKVESIIIWGMLHNISGKEIRENLEKKGLYNISNEK